MRKYVTRLLVAVTALALAVGFVPDLSGPAPAAEANPGTNWNASYYSNPNLEGTPALTRVDNQIDFNWATGSPDPAIPADNFSVRWTQTVNFPASGQWTFRVGADDGVRMWIDVTPIIDEWHGAPNGYTTYQVTLDQLTAGPHELRVEYYEATGNAGVQAQWLQGTAGAPAAGQPSTVTTTTGAGGTANWSAQYFNNTDLSGTPVISRTDGKIDFNWGTGSPDPAVQADNFSARWTTTVNFPTTGLWSFRVGADDGVRMWVDVTPIIDEWHGAPNGFTTYTADLHQLTAGDHQLRVEYYESSGPAGVLVEWYAGGAPGTAAQPGAAVQPTPTPPPVKPIWAAATGNRVNVRTGPGLNFPVVTQIFYPDNFKVVGALGTMRWILIELDDGTTAWVSNDWVYLYSDEPDFVSKIPKIEPEAAPDAVTAPQPQQVTVRGRARDVMDVRDAASNRGKVIAGVPQNAILTIEAISRNGAWYLMTWEGIRGWVYGPSVALTEGRNSDLIISNEIVPSPPSGQIFTPLTETGQPAIVRGRATTNINLRDAASVRGQDLGTVTGGTEFLIEGRNRNGAWYLVNIDGQSGWISSPYVRIIEGRYQDLQIR